MSEQSAEIEDLRAQVEHWQQKWKQRGVVLRGLREERDAARRESAEHLALIDGQTASELLRAARRSREADRG